MCNCSASDSACTDRLCVELRCVRIKNAFVVHHVSVDFMRARFGKQWDIDMKDRPLVRVHPANVEFYTEPKPGDEPEAEAEPEAQAEVEAGWALGGWEMHSLSSRALPFRRRWSILETSSRRRRSSLKLQPTRRPAQQRLWRSARGLKWYTMERGRSKRPLGFRFGGLPWVQSSWFYTLRGDSAPGPMPGPGRFWFCFSAYLAAE